MDFVNNIPERSILINAFIDTGATCSVIDSSILEEDIEIEPTTYVAKMNFINALMQDLPVYKVGLDLLNNGFCRDTLVCVMNMSTYSSEIKMLIGRDILRNCVFTYSGIDNTFTLNQKY